VKKPSFKVGQTVDYVDEFQYGSGTGEAKLPRQGRGEIKVVLRTGGSTRGKIYGLYVTDSRLGGRDRYLAIPEDKVTVVKLEGLDTVYRAIPSEQLLADGPQLAAPAAPPVNPKAAFGATKPSVGLVPPIALLHAAMAFEDGARKYGAFNWRDNPVEAMTYINALYRHLGLFLDGDDYTSDTKVHNLGAIIACAGILLDSQEAGTLIDNRPKPAPSDAVQNRLKAQKVEEQKARSEG
jgi:dATP/dGTP diphosphohydrolase